MTMDGSLGLDAFVMVGAETRADAVDLATSGPSERGVRA